MLSKESSVPKTMSVGGAVMLRFPATIDVPRLNKENSASGKEGAKHEQERIE